MSNYTQSTNFATKDALSSGDPLKIVKGTEINTEFNNISTAIATKADLASPTFTGTPLAPTASASTNNTQIATTAYADAAVTAIAAVIKSALFPVGAIYTAVVSTNPGTLLGFGTWTAFGAGRVLIGDGGGFSAGATGGSADAVVVSHNHTASSSVSDPSHAHGPQAGQYVYTNAGGIDSAGGGGFISGGIRGTTTASASTGITVSTTNTAAGVSGTNANLQPYVVVYMWNRTA